MRRGFLYAPLRSSVSSTTTEQSKRTKSVAALPKTNIVQLGNSLGDSLSFDRSLTKILSTYPLIICADSRRGPPNPASAAWAHFLYLSASSRDLVIVASLTSIKEHLDSLIARTSVPVDTPTPSPFNIAVAPGKGLGAFATRDIAAGEVILRERPVIVRTSEDASEERNYPPGHLLRAAVASLSTSSSRAFLELKNAYGSDTDLLQGIFSTNADVAVLGTGDADLADASARSSAVYATISRFNHDCTPSSAYHFDSQRFAGALRAVRDIKEGEEITICYTWAGFPRAQRQKVIRDAHFFDCTCTACSFPPELAAESDRRRSIITDLSINFKELARTLSWDEFVSRVEEAVRAVREEGISAVEGRLLLAAVSAASTVKNDQYALEWLDRRKLAVLKTGGPDAWVGVDEMLDVVHSRGGT